MTTTIRRNSGLYTLRRLAWLTCQALVKFGPYLRLFFADRPTLIQALAALEAACHEVVTEIDEAKAAIYPP